MEKKEGTKVVERLLQLCLSDYIVTCLLNIRPIIGLLATWDKAEPEMNVYAIGSRKLRAKRDWSRFQCTVQMPAELGRPQPLEAGDTLDKLFHPFLDGDEKAHMLIAGLDKKAIHVINWNLTVIQSQI